MHEGQTFLKLADGRGWARVGDNDNERCAIFGCLCRRLDLAELWDDKGKDALSGEERLDFLNSFLKAKWNE